MPTNIEKLLGAQPVDTTPSLNKQTSEIEALLASKPIVKDEQPNIKEFKKSLEQQYQQSLTPEFVAKEYQKRHAPSPFEPISDSPLPAKDFWGKVDELKDNPGQLVPFLSGGQDAVKYGKLLLAANRYNKGEESPDDFRLLQEYVAESERDTTFGYKVLNTISFSIPFALEIGITGGIAGLGRAALMKGGKETLKHIITKKGKEAFLKRAVKWGVAKTIQTGVAGSTQIWSNTQQKQLNSTINQIQTGEEKEDLTTSLAKAFGEQWVETLSEFSGGLLAPVSKYVGNNLAKVALFSVFKKANPATDPSVLARIVKYTGWNGIIGEMFEERIGAVGHQVMNAIGLGDQKPPIIPSAEQLAIEFTAFSVPGVGLAAANRLLEREKKVGPEGMTMQNVEPEIIDFTGKPPVVPPVAPTPPPISIKTAPPVKEKAEEVIIQPPTPERPAEAKISPIDIKFEDVVKEPLVSAEQAFEMKPSEFVDRYPLALQEFETYKGTIQQQIDQLQEQVKALRGPGSREQAKLLRKEIEDRKARIERAREIVDEENFNFQLGLTNKMLQKIEERGIDIGETKLPVTNFEDIRELPEKTGFFQQEFFDAISDDRTMEAMGTYNIKVSKILEDMLDSERAKELPRAKPKKKETKRERERRETLERHKEKIARKKAAGEKVGEEIFAEETEVERVEREVKEKRAFTKRIVKEEKKEKISDEIVKPVEKKPGVMVIKTTNIWELKIPADLVNELWSNGEPLFINNDKYSVHKMSYGEFFLEPFGKERGEQEGFAPGTLFLEKIEDENFYKVNFEAKPEVKKREEFVEGVTEAVKAISKAKLVQQKEKISEEIVIPKKKLPRVAWKRLMKGQRPVKTPTSWGTQFFQTKAEIPDILKNIFFETTEAIFDSIVEGERKEMKLLGRVEKDNQIVFEVEGEKVQFNADLVNALRVLHPDADLAIVGDINRGRLVFIEKGDIRAVVMRIIGEIGDITPLAKVEAIPSELQPLAQEARKYKTAEEFVNDIRIARGAEKSEIYKSNGQSILKNISHYDFENIIPKTKPQLTDFYNQAVAEKPNFESFYKIATKSIKPEIKNEILETLPERPDFLPINASSFNKIVDKYGSKDFFDNLYRLQDEGKLEVNHEAEAIRIFKGIKEVKPKAARAPSGQATALSLPVGEFEKTPEGKEIADVLRGARDLTADQIMQKYPDIQLKRDVPATDIYGNKIKIPEGEALTPYELKGNKILLQDGETYIVSKNQFYNIKGQSVVAEAKEFAPELKGLEESVRGGERKVIKKLPMDARIEKSNDGIFRVFNKNGTLLGSNKYRNIAIDEAIKFLNDQQDLYKGAIKFSQYQLPGGSNYKEILIKAPTKPEDFIDSKLVGRKLPTKALFQSPHWDEPNPIFHIRVNERTYKGKEVTFLEEAQSDWARAMREGKDVPTHPLVQGNKWQEPAVKRALQEAVANDSDYFAWITGEQTSARYNLATHLDNVDWKSGGANNAFKRIELTAKGRARGQDLAVVVNKEGKILETLRSTPNEWQGKKLDEVLGKGLADKIMSKESGTLSGEGLKFGGEWATNLYDRQIKNIVEDVTGGKVEKLDMGLPVEKPAETTREIMRQNINMTPTEAEELYWSQRSLMKTTTQQGIKLTPEIKAIIRGEVPVIKTSGQLFAKRELEERKTISEEILKPKELRAPSGLAAAKSDKIGEYESDEEAKVQGLSPYRNFKLYEKVQALIQKYAKTVGQGYTPRGALGVFYAETENIRVNGINDLSVASHEITHFLDKTYQIVDKIMGIKGYSATGNPIYEKESYKIRREMTDLYEKYYPGGKRKHKLKKRMTEGFATLLQKYAQAPKSITAEFPNLVKEFLREGGKYYHPVMGEIIADLRALIAEYQGLNELDKIGARIVDGTVNINKDEWLNTNDRIFEEIADNVYPAEKLAKITGVHFTKADPSLWVRQYNNINQLITNNINGKRGYWGWRNGEFVKIHDFNWRDLFDLLVNEKTTRDFNSFLVARNEHFLYQELEELQALEELNKEQQARIHNLEIILRNDGFTKDEVDAAYAKNQERFTKEAQMFDTLVREDLNFLHGSDVQLVDTEQFEKLTSREGYASMKREFYDEIVGEEELPVALRVGKIRISSLIQRKGSQRPIISPLYSGIANHSEITKKGMRQIVYNSFGNIADKAPALFQKIPLKVVPDAQGRFIFPQEKDPHIIMTRRNYKRVPILTDGTIKRVIDEVLTPHNIGIFERLVMGSSRFFTKGTTGLFPAFAITNVIRDQLTAWGLTRNKFIPLYDPLKAITKALAEKDTSRHRYFIEYLVMGGERMTIVGWQDLSPNELAVKLRGELKGLEKVLEGMNRGMDVLAFPAKWSEIMTRAAEYIKAREAGKPTIVAIEEAGRVSIPFHHIGRLGGGRFGKTFVKSIPFFNPGLQVLAQTYRNLDTVKAQKRMLFVFLALTAAEVASFSLLAAGGDDEQKQAYRDMEGREIADAIYLPNPAGKTLIRIPVPNVFTWLGAIINMALADGVLKAKYSVGDYIAAGTAYLPQQLNITKPIEALFAWIPQIAKPAILAALNKQDFPRIRPLESIMQEAKTPGMRFTERTSPAAKALGKKLNISPIKIDYLLTGYFGRATGFVTGKPGIYDPFRGINREYYFQSGRSVQNFYDLKKKNQQEYHDYKNRLLKYSPAKVREIKRTRERVKFISEMLDTYRDINIEKQPERASRLRGNILESITELNETL